MNVTEIKMDKNILLMPVIVSVTLTGILLYGLHITDSLYKNKIICISIFLVLIWVSLFLIHNKKRQTIKMKSNSLFDLTIILSVSFLIGIVFSCFVWGKGYLSLSPVARIDNGTQHADTLFHSAIAESFGRSMIPRALVNEERTLPYHTFSHLLLKGVAELVSMPTFIIYNYIYPILFLPAYIFAQITSIKCAKKYFIKSKELCIMDVIIIGIYNVGIFQNQILSACGVWKSSYVVSESFLIANTLAYLSYAVLFSYIQKDNINKILNHLFIIVGIPAMIFCLSWAKISVGFLFTASVMYYILRQYWRSIKGWGVEIIYALVFLLSVYLFNRGSGTAGGIMKEIQLFAFEKYCENMYGFMGHYFILILMGGIFIILEIIFNKYSLRKMIRGKALFIEEILIVSILGFLPAFMIDINGGSAGYFSYAVETLALILLCGNNKINHVIQKMRGAKWKKIIPCSMCIWCIYIGIDTAAGVIQEDQMIIKDDVPGFYTELMNLREIMDGEPEAYTFYLDNDSKVAELFQEPLAAIYVHPGLTGAGVINASYCMDGKYFLFDGTEIGGYGLKDVNNEKLSFEKAKMKAIELGKKYLIHASENGYEIVQLYLNDE